MNNKPSPKKESILKLGQYKTISTQNKISIDYYLRKKHLYEHTFDILKPNIYTIRQYLNPKLCNYYICVGLQSPEISSILKNIQTCLNNRRTLNLKESEKKKIVSTFGKEYKTILGFHHRDYQEINYIFILIEQEDSIEIIKKKINIYINSNIYTNYQYLWVNYDQNNRLIYHKKNKFFLRISNDKVVYLNTLTNNISSITGELVSESSLDFPKNTNTINFSEFDDNNKVSNYIDFSHETLGFVYNDISVLGLVNPFFDNNPHKFEVSCLDKRKHILMNYGDLKNNIINLVNFNDFNKINPEFKNVSKYWPHLNNSSKNDYQADKKIFDNMAKVINYLHQKPVSSKLIFHSLNYQQAIININSFDEVTKNIEKEDFINLDKIFDVIDLSYEVPFIRYNEGLLDNVKYKLYKPITINKNGKPFVEKDKILQWGNINRKIKIRKGLHIYQLFGKKNDENEFQKLAISSDGKLELRITWKNMKANFADLERSLDKCQNFISYLNNEINYNVKINSDDKIKSPCSNINSYKNLTTEISSIMCLMNIEALKPLEISSIFEYCREYLYDFVSVELKKENNIDKSIIIKYKRVDNYKPENAVFNFLEQNYSSSNFRDIDVVNKINYLFKIGKEKSLFLVNEYKKRTSYENSNNQYTRNIKSKSDGYHIQINKQLNKMFKVAISGVKNHNHIKYIVHFIKTLFTVVIEKDIIQFDDIKDTDDIEKLMESVTNSISSIDSDNMFSELDEDAFYSENEELDNLEHLTPLEDLDIPVTNTSVQPMKADQQNREKLPIDSRYIINRLKEYDSTLFNINKKSNNTKSRQYTKACQGVDNRQPIVISQKEKDKIDKKYKGSYSEAIKYSSDPSITNYYICPYIWCAKCNISLRPKDVRHNKNEHMSCPECGGVPFDNSSKNKNGTLFVKKQNYWTAKWDSDFPSQNKWLEMFPGFLDPKRNRLPNGLCLPCCFSNKNTPRDIEAKEICLNNKSVETIKDDKYEKYVSGWKKFPVAENRLGGLPDILNKIFENNTKEAFNEGGDAGNLKENVPIFVRKGIKQTRDNSLIDSIISIAEESNFLPDAKCLSKNINDICQKIDIRIFISLNDGELITIFDNNEPINKDRYSSFHNWILNNYTQIDNFMDHQIIKNTHSLDMMNKHNEGTKYSFLKLYQIYNSFNNFINYLKSDKIKDIQLLWELLSMKNIIFEDDVNIIIFEIIDEKVYQMCPKWFNDGYIRENKDTCFLIKQDNRYEPIFNIFDHNTLRIVARHFVGRFNKNYEIANIDDNMTLELFDYQSIQFLMNNANNFCLNIENNYYKKYMIENNYLYSHTSKQIYRCLVSIDKSNYHPFYQIVNDNFKCTAFIINDIEHHNSNSSRLNNKILIPFPPSRILPNIPILFGLHHYKPNSYQVTLKTLLEIESLTKKNIKSPIDFIIIPKERVIDPQGQTYLINTATNHLIPVMKEKINDTYPTISNTIDINLDYKISKFEKLYDEREISISKYKLENNLYQQFRFEIAKIISSLLKNRKKSLKNIDPFKQKIYFLLDILNSSILTIIKKTKMIKSIILDIIHNHPFYFDENNNIDIHQNFNKKTRKVCSSNKIKKKCSILNLCIWDDNQCSLYIPGYNLNNPKIKNKDQYINLLVEELIRNNIKRNEILNGTVPEVISHSINPTEIIITDDNYNLEIDKLYNLNDNILYDSNYPEKGYDDYYIDNKFLKKPVPKKCLHLLRDAYTYNDFPGVVKDYDINYKTLSLLVSEDEIDIKNKIMNTILSQGYNNFLSKYESINFKDYSSIHNKEDFSYYFQNQHYINLFDIQVFSKIYNLNIILIYEQFQNYIELLKNNKTDQYYIIQVFIKVKKGTVTFLNYLVLLEEKSLFDYKSFSPNLKRLINIRHKKNTLVSKINLYKINSLGKLKKKTHKNNNHKKKTISHKKKSTNSHKRR